MIFLNKLLIKKVKELKLNTNELAEILGTHRDKAREIVKFIRTNNKNKYNKKSNLPTSEIFTSDLFDFLGLNISSIKSCKDPVQIEEIDYIFDQGLYTTIDVQKMLGFKRFETAKKRVDGMRDLNPFYYQNKKSILKDTEVSAVDVIKYYGFSKDDINKAISFHL